MSIFRAYDIRGVYPDQLNGDIAYKIGLAFGKFLGGGTIALAMDVRESGPDLRENLLKGMMESGLKVVDIGIVPTPVLYFTVAFKNLDGGAMITGSHNPKEYNGVKLCGKKGVCLSYETGIRDVEKFVKEGVESPNLESELIKMQMGGEYVDFVAGKVKFKRPLRIVIDAGNGVAGMVSCEIFRKLGCEVIGLNCEPDGRFPNHHPDPLERENLKQLQAKVKEAKADMGIAYDGDGDRVGFVDEKGEIFENNKAFGLIIENLLEENPGGKVIHEVLTSKLVEDIIRKKGGVPVISRVGHSYIQRKMFEENAIVGGETSGHYYFRESYNYDDGIFGSAKLAELLSRSDKPMSELGKELPKYITSDDTRIHCPDEKKFQVVESLRKKFGGMGKMVTIDGVKVILEGSWFIVRASNTQPALVLRWEARDKKEFERVGALVKKEVESEIKAIS
ncbi:MAG: phosphomannomutase/phosphoglucomutase [Candidatus Aenigmarchaeota archaeon]